MTDTILDIEEAAFMQSQTQGSNSSKVNNPSPQSNSLERTSSNNYKKYLTYSGLSLLTSSLAAGSIYLCVELVNYINNNKDNSAPSWKIEGARYSGIGLGMLGVLYLGTAAVELWRCSQPKKPGPILAEVAMAACGPVGLCTYACARSLGD